MTSQKRRYTTSPAYDAASKRKMAAKPPASLVKEAEQQYLKKRVQVLFSAMAAEIVAHEVPAFMCYPNAAKLPFTDGLYSLEIKFEGNFCRIEYFTNSLRQPFKAEISFLFVALMDLTNLDDCLRSGIERLVYSISTKALFQTLKHSF